MIRITLFALACFIFISCSQHKTQEIDKDDYRNEMTESSKLFFRNVRQSYYDLEEHKPSKSEIFRISERDQSEDKPVLNAYIRQVVVQDQVFIMLEPNQYLSDLEEFTVSWEDMETKEKGTYALPARANASLHYTFASEIYTSIQKGHQLKIKTAKGLEPLFPSDKASEAFRKTMVDFYRLVNVL